ncbi:glycosyltransferase [Anabaena cylindrica FACHB-243]|uniref:Glycosyl transferase n=1 Tax=Anabaena cylindrica (strain ATCC 27899 / PCC 7122) TaxID=272123 RepID=K9ZKH4_ANACC|nr:MULTISPECIES: glycosyltransferase family 10 [Anabaena]AFZ58830.1 putative glycosyl transferase [Anabaena cylindrica PCC 7122]MBD2416472.1 glycosyltransferase [Anabaena cylindrica FACHB-243]MBY5282572.1 glycosyltransferase [Anabaena sp. CCAP 1446/1C]MBY5307286.1 glycosyltransferase [Anabaena sp. CCAP 1446/1C]MCM2409455.1 glycosyltransferase family 10 [Anabaena sp. CCAP 1446/1C]
MKTVGMISSYRALESRADWLWQQTPHPFGVWENIKMQALAEKPDFLLMYQFDFPRPSPPPSLLDRLRKKQPKPELNIHNLLRNVSKEQIIYLLREPPLDEILEINKRNYQQAENYCGYISGPDDFAPIPNYMPAIWYHSNSFKDLNEMPCPQKVSNCSWITSGINRTANHRQRLDFLQSLKSSGMQIDFYGRGLEKWVKTSGELGNKWYGMAPYYYNLAIENYADNSWYVSEKLWDSLLAWCLPIYYGGQAADKLLPPGSFLRLPSLDEKGIAYIQEITATPDAWYAAKDAIAEARQIILHKLNLLNWLSEFATKFS